jgi:hypothetical protein
MKKSFTLGMVLVLFVLMGISSCKNQPNQAKDTTNTENIEESDSVVAERLKTEVINIIQNAPKAGDLVEMINQAGAAYILNLTVPVESSQKMMTTVDRSLGIGMYAFDMKYASVYNRFDITSSLRGVLQELLTANGMPLDLRVMDQYAIRIKDNQSNKDSLDLIIGEVTDMLRAHLADSDQPEIYALTFIGANVEALFILSQVTLLARDNSQFLAIISKQHERVKIIHQLLGKIGTNESITPYFEKFEPILNFFENHPTIGESELKEIAPAIEELRNFMLG